jgi:hypothetical protein
MNDVEWVTSDPPCYHSLYRFDGPINKYSLVMAQHLQSGLCKSNYTGLV